VKRLTAIWFSLLLMWLQFAPAPAAAPAACCRPGMGKGGDCCAQMPCCATQPDSSSQPAPVTPTSYGIHNQIALAAPALLAWASPGENANQFSAARLPLNAALAMPLYERHCALLL
jgi:hypothetical protein